MSMRAYLAAHQELDAAVRKAVEHVLRERPESPVRVIGELLLVSSSSNHDYCHNTSASPSASLATLKPAAPSQEHSKPRVRWEADIDMCFQLTNALFTNQFEEAERICTVGTAQAPLPPTERVAPNGDRYRDTRATFAMIYALFHAGRSMMLLERDALATALPGLYKAQDLLDDKDMWVASRLVAGLLEATIGALHCMQHSYISGLWHLVKAYGSLRSVDVREMLNFEGMEHSP